MSKEEGEMVQSRTRKGSGAARPESGPTARPGRTLWRGGSGGARDGNGTWCCGCCGANRWREIVAGHPPNEGPAPSTREGCPR